MSYQTRRPLLGAAIAVALGSVATQTAAQRAELEEIIVTAERRETSLQQTPISVAAFSAETMETKGLETVAELSTVTPNLDIKGSRGSGDVSPTYQVRGISGGGGLGERSVAMYIDGIFMPRTTGPYLNVLDIERIEVLRGPQGTLFGRNSTGGAIRVFTKQPGPDLEGHLRLTAGDFDRTDVSAMVNVPISDSLFFRAQAASLSQDGYLQRGSQMLGATDDKIGRMQLAIEPSDSLRVTFGLSATQSENNGSPQDFETFDMNPNLNFQGNRTDWVSDFLQAAGQARLIADNDPRVLLDDFTMPDWCFLDDANPDWDPLCEQINESEYQQFDVNLTWDLNDRWSLTSITGASDFESHGIYDFVLLGTERRHNDSTSEVLYQELQLNASFDRLDFVTGISYFDEDVFGSPGTGSPNYDRRGTSAFPAAANGNTVDLGGFGPNGLFVTVLTDGLQQGESIGVFGNLTWHVTERLNITPGVRWAFDEKSVSQTRFRANDFTPFGGAASTTVLADQDWDNTDWRLTGDYHFTQSHMLYLTASESFRAGAYSYTIDPASSGAAQTQAIANGVAVAFTPPEKVRNDEIGFRTEWIDGRLRVNLTYFETEYTDRQGPIQVQDPTSPTGFRIQLVNTGDVDLQGYELEGQIAVAENFAIDFSAGLVDYTVKDPCANGGDFVFPGPIEDSYSLGGRWIRPLDSGADITVAVNFAHDGPQQTHAGGTAGPCFSPITGLADPVPTWFFDSRYELPDYDLVNARVRYTTSGGTWALTVFGNNLTDEVYASFASRFGGGFWDAANPAVGGGIALPLRSALSATRGRPREYGVMFQYNFGAGGSAGR